jgi:uncharacterized membrane protein
MSQLCGERDETATEHSRAGWLAVTILALLWLAVYGWRVTVGYYSLATNAFDLSVFDLAIDSLSKGGRGIVEFQQQSIFSQHFMPILGLLVPLHLAFRTPLVLLYGQVAAVAVSGLLLFEFQRRLGIRPASAALLVGVFLFCRRTHGAVAGSFYPEALQCPLTIGMILAWPVGGWRYWVCVVLLLMTKEDAAVYVGAFALVAAFVGRRGTIQGIATLALALIWGLWAFGFAIPSSRAADGLAAANPILEQRFGIREGSIDASLLAERLFSTATSRRAVSLAATTGGLALLGPEALVPAVPGLVVNLMADPRGQQAALEGHYAWAVLPWLFLAAAIGLATVSRRSRRVALVWLSLLLAVCLVDNPALQRLSRTKVEPEAAMVRTQVADLAKGVVLAQPNLIPHLGYDATIYALDPEQTPPLPPDVVLLTTVGDLWPFTEAEILQAVSTYRHDNKYREIRSGPLYAFLRTAD